MALNTAATSALQRPRTRSRRSTRPTLAVVASPSVSRSSTPFVLLCTLIVVGTLLTVLFLNIQMSGTSYQITRLQGQTQRLTDQAQVLQETNDQLSTPQELEKRATDLGMVPAGSPAYIDLDSGTVVGDAVPVTDSTDRTDSGVVPASRAYPTDEPYHGMGNSADEGE